MKINAEAKETAERALAMFKQMNVVKTKLTTLIQNKWQPIPNISTPKEIFTNPSNTDVEVI